VGLYSQGTEAEGGIFSDLFGGHDTVENMWVYTPKGLRLRVEYSLTCLEVILMWRICGLYSQGTEAEFGIFSDLSGGHEYEE
jgi:hypothetical protein